MRTITLIAIPLFLAACEEEPFELSDPPGESIQERAQQAGGANGIGAETCGCPPEVLRGGSVIVENECETWGGGELCIELACQVQHPDGALSWYACR